MTLRRGSPCPAVVTLLLVSLAYPGGVLCANDSEQPMMVYGIGRPASTEDIEGVDVDVMPGGHGLPRGAGSVPEGAAIYAVACAYCHGDGGRGGSFSALAGGPDVGPGSMAADRTVIRTIGNYWPYATTLFDYIRRAMPFDRPGSLSNREVYAVTAYLLHLNGLVAPDTELDADSLPDVVMPARVYFRPDRRDSGAKP